MVDTASSEGAIQHQAQPAHAHASHHDDRKRLYAYLFIAAFAVIILLNIYLRTGMLQFQGMFEPDGFFYLTALKQAVANNFIVTATVNLSGYPFHNGFNEAPGLLYFALVPYAILQYFGLSAYDVIRLIPILFGILDAIGAYWLVKYMSDNRLLGLLAAALVSFSSGNIARTAGTVFRGDTFISFFAIVVLVLMLKVMTEKNRRKKYIYAGAAAFVTGISSMVWSGGFFVPAEFFAAATFLTFYTFLSANREGQKDVLLLFAALIAAWMINAVFLIPGWAKPSPLSEPFGLLLFAIMGAASLVSYYIIGHMHRHSEKKTAMHKLLFTMKARALTLIVLVIIGVAALFITLGSYLGSLSTVGLFAFNSGFIGGTTQELQAPTLGFLWASNGLELLLASLGFFFALMVLADKVWGRRMSTVKVYVAALSVAVVCLLSIFVYGFGQLGSTWGTILIMFLPGLLGLVCGFFISMISSRPADADNVASVIKELRAIPAYGIAVVSVYLLTTTYLQSGAIRYNSMISIPIAIFSAFALYFGYALLKQYVINMGGTHVPLSAAFGVIVLILLLYQFTLTAQQSFSSGQADGINPYFLQAMTWVSQNTPASSRFLALWPDGSVVEGWGNRTSFMDSVGGENGTRILYFSQFLFNNSADTKYLTGAPSTGADKPDYVLVRNFFLNELGGIAEEANLTGNLSQYGYSPLYSFQSGGNSTYQVYQFSSSQYTARMIILRNATNPANVQIDGYLGQAGSTSGALMAHVLLQNSSSYAYNLTSPSASSNALLNYTLLVQYSGRNITGASVVGPKLEASNFFKLLYMCDASSCAYGSANVTARMAYGNADSKIIALSYT